MNPTLIAILGILVAAYAAYLLNDTIKTKELFIKSATEFRKPFDETKCILDLNVRGIHENCDIREVFISHFTEQKRAIAAFEPVLPRRFRKSIREAWTDYEKYISDENISSWFDSSNLFKDDDEVLRKRKESLNKIDKVLLFSDYHNIYSILRIPRWKV